MIDLAVVGSRIIWFVLSIFMPACFAGDNIIDISVVQEERRETEKKIESYQKQFAVLKGERREVEREYNQCFLLHDEQREKLRRRAEKKRKELESERKKIRKKRLALEETRDDIEFFRRRVEARYNGRRGLPEYQFEIRNYIKKFRVEYLEEMKEVFIRWDNYLIGMENYISKIHQISQGCGGRNT